MNQLEIEILKSIGKHYPIINNAIDKLKVSNRELTGAGSYTNFEPLSEPLNSEFQMLDLHGTVDLENGVQLSAHIQLNEGVPEHLEICCLSEGEWSGEYSEFHINN